MAEQRTLNATVGGSTPLVGTHFILLFLELSPQHTIPDILTNFSSGAIHNAQMGYCFCIIGAMGLVALVLVLGILVEVIVCVCTAMGKVNVMHVP